MRRESTTLSEHLSYDVISTIVSHLWSMGVHLRLVEYNAYVTRRITMSSQADLDAPYKSTNY